MFGDPSGMYPQRFGYAIEKEVAGYYQRQFGDKGVFFGKMVGGLKPDILDTRRKRWMEIKPLSLSGIAKAVVQWEIYTLVYASVSIWPDVSWTPTGEKLSKIRVQGRPTTIVNIGGILFYTDITENLEELAAVGSIYAASKLRDWVRRQNQISWVSPEASLNHGLIIANQLEKVALLTLVAIIPTAMYLSTRGVN